MVLPRWACMLSLDFWVSYVVLFAITLLLVALSARLRVGFFNHLRGHHLARAFVYPHRGQFSLYPVPFLHSRGGGRYQGLAGLRELAAHSNYCEGVRALSVCLMCLSGLDASQRIWAVQTFTFGILLWLLLKFMHPFWARRVRKGRLAFRPGVFQQAHFITSDCTNVVAGGAQSSVCDRPLGELETSGLEQEAKALNPGTDPGGKRVR